jgi:adenylate cyclase
MAGPGPAGGVRFSLKLKLSLPIAALVIVTVVLVGTLRLRQAEQGLTEAMEKRGRTIARDFANSSRHSLLTGDELTLNLLVTDALKNPDVAYVVVADQDGKVLAHPDLRQIGQPLARPAEWPVPQADIPAGVIIHPQHGRILDFAAPLVFSGVRIGALYLGFSQRTIEQALAKARTQAIFISTGLVVLGILAGFRLAFGLVRPVNRLVEATKSIAAGDFKVALPVTSRDEIGLLTNSFNQMARSLGEKEMIKRAFSRYVARQVVQEILKDPERLVLREERRDVTVLFCEIEAFTTVAARLEPAEVIRLLNDFFGLMIDTTFRHDGTLNEFFGDGVMAFFGAPITDRDHALHAVRTALDMQAGVAALSERRIAEGQIPIAIRIGINAGEVVAGTVGSEDRMKYAVVGDNVNLAARLQSHAKAGQILLSQQTFERVKDWVDAYPLGSVKVKGKQEVVEMLEVRGLRPGPT